MQQQQQQQQQQQPNDVFAAIQTSKNRDYLTSVVQNDDLDRRDQSGLTPLMLAAALDNVVALDVLLDHEVPVNQVNGTNQTALHIACMKGSTRCVAALIDRRADVEVQEKGSKQTPLHFACSAAANVVDTVRELLREGADVNAVAKDGWTPLHYAAFKGRTEMCRALVASGAEINAALESSNDVLLRFRGATPRRLAEQMNHQDVAQYLASLGGIAGAAALPAPIPVASASAPPKQASPDRQGKPSLQQRIAQIRNAQATAALPSAGNTNEIRRLAALGHKRVKTNQVTVVSPAPQPQPQPQVQPQALPTASQAVVHPLSPLMRPDNVAWSGNLPRSVAPKAAAAEERPLEPVPAPVPMPVEEAPLSARLDRPPTRLTSLGRSREEMHGVIEVAPTLAAPVPAAAPAVDHGPELLALRSELKAQSAQCKKLSDRVRFLEMVFVAFALLTFGMILLG